MKCIDGECIVLSTIVVDVYGHHNRTYTAQFFFTLPVYILHAPTVIVLICSEHVQSSHLCDVRTIFFIVMIEQFCHETKRTTIKRVLSEFCKIVSNGSEFC